VRLATAPQALLSAADSRAVEDSRYSASRASSSNYRIQVFDHNERFLFQWGTGKFMAPQWLSIGEADNRPGTDLGTEGIQKFTVKVWCPSNW